MSNYNYVTHNARIRASSQVKIPERRSAKFPGRLINTNSCLQRIHHVRSRTTCRSRTTGVSASTLCGDESQPVTKLQREAALIPPAFLLEVACHSPPTSLLSYAFRDWVSATQFATPPLCVTKRERRYGPLVSRRHLVPSHPFTSTERTLSRNWITRPSPWMWSLTHIQSLSIDALYAEPAIQKSDFSLFVVSHSDRDDRASHSWSCLRIERRQVFNKKLH